MLEKRAHVVGRQHGRDIAGLSEQTSSKHQIPLGEVRPRDAAEMRSEVSQIFGFCQENIKEYGLYFIQKML